MEFQSPPTSLTDEEAAMRAEFQKRVDFTNDLNDASDFLKWHWMHTPVSPVPLEIKTHVLEDDPIVARHEFEARSLFLEEQHSPEEGRTFKAYGHRHEATTQHFAELAFRNGTVKYVVVWIEQDAEVTGTEICQNTYGPALYGHEGTMCNYVADHDGQCGRTEDDAEVTNDV